MRLEGCALRLEGGALRLEGGSALLKLVTQLETRGRRCAQGHEEERERWGKGRAERGWGWYGGMKAH